MSNCDYFAHFISNDLLIIGAVKNVKFSVKFLY